MLCAQWCSLEGERVYAEIAVWIAPGNQRLPAGAPRQRAEGIGGIFIAAFGVNGFTGTEVDAFAGHPHPLPPAAREMHFDAMTLPIVKGTMLETLEIECATELAVDAREKVEVEGARDARGIVISRVQDAAVLLQVG